MAEPTSRPRPRPRPRPVVKQTSEGSSTPNPSASYSSGSGIEVTGDDGTRRVIQVHDTDEMFMRNRNRTTKTWQKLDQVNKEVPKVVRDDSPDSDDYSPGKATQKRKKESHVPIWQKSQEITRLLSQALSDDSEDDIEFLGESSTPKGKRKRKERSLSRSITPPPALPEHQLQNARNVVRQTLQGPVRPPSPTYVDPDESADSIIFQPELSAIAQEVAENVKRASSQAPPDGPEDHIVVTVKWQPHPLDPNGKTMEWQYKLDRNDNFRDLFEAAAEDACIRSANLIMTYQSKRFFPSVTPHTLNIWGDTAELVAYEKKAFEYIQQNPAYVQHPSTGQPLMQIHAGGAAHMDSDAEDVRDNAATPPAQTQDSEAESEAEGETFRLVLRSSGNKDVALTVRPTTKCGAILKAFLKRLGLVDQYPGVFADPTAKKKGGRKSKAAIAAEAKDPRLCIDGDKMDNQTEIGDMDLEDGDMVEVVGL